MKEYFEVQFTGRIKAKNPDHAMELLHCCLDNIEARGQIIVTTMRKDYHITEKHKGGEK